MSSRTRVFALLAAGASLALTDAGAQEISEREAVRLFLSQSAQSRELRAGVAAVEAESRGWSLWPNPSASFSREGAGVNEFWQMEQRLAVNGRLGFMRQAGIAAVGAAGAQSSFALWQLVSDLRMAFYEVLVAQEREAVLRSNLTRIQEVVRVLAEREKQGEGSTYDRLRVEREQAELETDVVSAQVATGQARGRLASLLPVKTEPSALSVSGRIESAVETPPLADLLSRALQARGDFKAEQRQFEQFQLQQRASERLRIPEPSVTAGVKRGEVVGGMATGAYVAVSIPILVFNKGKEEVARWKAESERAQARQQIVEQRILAEIKAAYATLEMRRRASQEYRRGLDTQSAQLDRIAQAAYQEGELSILSLLDAQRVTFQSRLRLLELTAAAKLAEIELERVVGEPALNKEVMP